MALDLGTIKPSGYEPGDPAGNTGRPLESYRSSRQWIRSVSVQFGSAGQRVDVSDLRIKFSVRQADAQTPNHAHVIIYNLKDETAQQAFGQDKLISVSAGYEDSEALIFEGEILQARKGRETPTDTFLHVLAANMNKAYNFGTVNKTLAAGHTFRDQVDMVFKEAFKPFGVELGFIADLGQQKMPRGRVLFGMGRDLMRTIGFATNTSWSIQGGKLQMVQNNGYVPGNAIKLNSRTGMVGLPVQTFQGIEVRCLLNPKIRPGTRIQIDQASIQEQQFSPSFSSGGVGFQKEIVPGLAADGFYKVLVADHDGDTRGQTFYSDMICIKADGGTIPFGLVPRGIVDPDFIGPPQPST